MSSVLDGVRVIDFGQYVAGQLAGMLLVFIGARPDEVSRLVAG